MRIGLNATCFNDRPSGARQRFVGIYGALAKRLPDVEFVVYEPADCRVSSWFGGLRNVSGRQTPIPSEGRAKKFFGGFHYWDSALAHESLDLFEGFNLPLVKAPGGRTLLTIHDIRGLQPDCGLLERAVFSTVLMASLKAADHVVTVSEAMKAEILDFYPKAEISVIYNGLDPRHLDPVPDSDLSAFIRKYMLPQDFLLSVGHIERRKNYLRLIDAFALLRNRGRNCYLVIAGNDSGERKIIEEHIRAVDLCTSVKILTGLSDLELRCAYRLCRLFVFPSTYEGFGIPILEAMAARRPMVLSNIPVFREVTQDLSVYFDPYDVDSIACTIGNVLSSNEECAGLIAYDNGRITSFNFSNLAAQVEELYRALL